MVLAFFLLEKGVPLPTSIQNSIKNDTNHSIFIDKLVPDAFFSGEPLIHMNNPHFWLAVLPLISSDKSVSSLEYTNRVYSYSYLNLRVHDLLSSQVIVIGTFVIAACFFTVFEMGVDTLFLCFCECLLAFTLIKHTINGNESNDH